MGRNNPDFQGGARPSSLSARQIVSGFRLWDAEAIGMSNKAFVKAKLKTVESPTVPSPVDDTERPNPQASLSKDIQKNGVKTPIDAEISPNGRPRVVGGHSRLSVMYKYFPDTPIQINWIDQ